MANIGGSGFLNSVRNYPTVMISVVFSLVRAFTAQPVAAIT